MSKHLSMGEEVGTMQFRVQRGENKKLWWEIKREKWEREKKKKKENIYM
jgi:hypothetical protein